MLGNRVRGYIKREGYLFLAFIIPVIILLGVYCFIGVYPFGNYSSMVIDEGAQYIYYFEYLREALLGKGGLIYSWSRTLGGEMLGLTAYYLTSPFSLIMLLFPKEYSTEAMYVMKLLKLGCCSLSFAIYMRHSRKAEKAHALLFSILYALMSFIVVQIENIMWVDSMILLPFMILGVERIITQKKYLLFTFICSIVFITNYYMGYMVGIFTFFYFIYYYVANDEKKSIKHFIKCFGMFVGSTFCAILCSAFVLLPVFYSLKLGKFGFNHPTYTPDPLFTLFDLFTKLLPSSYDTLRSGGLPFIYCGTLTLFLLPLYFLNTEIKIKDKFLSGALLIVLILSFHIKIVDLVWHGFQLPNDLPFRYAFMFCFILLNMAYSAFINRRALPYKTIALVYGGLSFLVLLIDKQGYEYIDTQECIWLALFCLTSFLVYFYLDRTYITSKLPQVFLIIILAIELIVNTGSNTVALNNEFVFHQRKSHRELIDETLPVVQKLNKEDSGFYRMEKTYALWENDPMGLGMKGLSHSSSLPHAKILSFLKKIGYGAGVHKVFYNSNTMLTDSLLSFKYVLSKTPVTPFYNKLFTIGEISAYENPYVLPIAYMASKNVENYNIGGADPFVSQNQMLSKILGQDYTEFFKPVSLTDTEYKNISQNKVGVDTEYTRVASESDSEVTFTLNTENITDYVYAYFPANSLEKAELFVNNEKIATCFDRKVNYIVPVGFASNTQNLQVVLKISGDKMYFSRAQFYYLDSSLLEEAMEKLQSQSLKITHVNNTKFEGEINVMEEDHLLFTSIPYEKGWQVKVDGKKVKTTEAFDAFLAVPVSPGNHTVSFTFFPKELTIGIILSVVGWIAFIVACLSSRLKNRKVNPIIEE